MRGPRLEGLVSLALVVSLAAIASLFTTLDAKQGSARAPSDTIDGGALFRAQCASCHAGTDPRIPTVDALRQRTPEAVLDTLTTGSMRQQGGSLTDAERRAIATYLSGRSPADRTDTSATAVTCASPPPLTPTDRVPWGGWGPSLSNARFQPAAQAGLRVNQIPRLKVKWAFGLPGATSARALPTVAGDRVFFGSQDGTVYALDARSGCTIWTFKAKAGVRAPVVIDTTVGSGITAYLGDGRSNVYALNAATGQLLWTRPVDDHPGSHITGAPAVYQGRVYVGVASFEEAQGNNATYDCCTFRGSIVALNASNGSLAWKTYTIDAEPGPIGKNRGGSTRFGPSGAGVWASPTIDAKRRLLYAATGNMYTEPQQKASDAVVAFDLDSGRIVWMMQATPNDVFVVGCNQPNPANCPTVEGLGPDFDFGNAPIVVTTASGRDLIVIGQKSGVGFALDPDKRGEIVWQYRAGKGSALGGMEFGSAADDTNAYFPVADPNQPTAGEIHAVRLATGERAWMAPPRPLLCGARGRGCTAAILAAITVIPGAVFAGAMDGGLRAYATTDGSLLWEFDTNREFQTVNGVKAAGASINGPGPIVAGGMVFVNSGYGALGGRPGNVLLAFAAE